MDVGSFLDDLGRVSSEELFESYGLAAHWESGLLRRCKQPLLSLGTVEHSAWEKEHNYGSTLLRLGLCESQRVLFRHRRSLYATRTHGCRYREELSNSYEPLGPEDLRLWNPKPRPPDPRIQDYWAWAIRVDSRWLCFNAQEAWRFPDHRSADRFLSKQDDPDIRVLDMAGDFEQQGPGISLADFKLRMAPASIFGY